MDEKITPIMVQNHSIFTELFTLSFFCVIVKLYDKNKRDFLYDSVKNRRFTYGL